MNPPDNGCVFLLLHLSAPWAEASRRSKGSPWFIHSGCCFSEKRFSFYLSFHINPRFSNIALCLMRWEHSKHFQWGIEFPAFSMNSTSQESPNLFLVTTLGSNGSRDQQLSQVYWNWHVRIEACFLCEICHRSYFFFCKLLILAPADKGGVKLIPRGHVDLQGSYLNMLIN